MSLRSKAASSENKILQINEQLLLGAVRQHELAEKAQALARKAEALNRQLQSEIMERRLIEESLRKSEERYRTLFDSIDEGFCVVEVEFAENGLSTDCRFLEANPSFAIQTGLPNPLGKRMSELVPSHNGNLFDEFGEISRSGVPRRFIKDSKELGKWFDVYAFRLGGSNENKVAAIFSNITPRINSEEILQHAQQLLMDRAGQLEGLVKDRTAELTATNKQLEAFVYSIAHDLRAPLRSMQGFSSMLIDQESAALSEIGLDLARRINKSALFMDSLLQDLLAFSSIAQQRVELTPVNLEIVLQSAVEGLEKEITQKAATVNLEGPWPVVLAHKATLRQVLVNLLTNALKFAQPNSPPNIRVYCIETGSLVRVWVEDNGIGIPADHQEQIFKLFTRLNGDHFPGTGIGLAIVQKGIERLNGRVGVESIPGKGSRFWFELMRA